MPGKGLAHTPKANSRQQGGGTFAPPIVGQPSPRGSRLHGQTVRTVRASGIDVGIPAASRGA